MPTVEKSVLVEYPAAAMFALIDGIERYPEFLPWCGGAEVTMREGETVRATLHIDYHGIKQAFTTENRASGGNAIDMVLVNGPFRHLNGAWRFTPLGDTACKVELHLSYEFSSRVLEKLVGPVFHRIANSFVEAFVKRARQLNGEP
ncbi:MAG: type II toxin-antitoxin system RatA family toxin [Burkholderiales bacterium]